MKYSKLPVVLLSSLSSMKADSTNAIILNTILEHINEDISIKLIAEESHVGIASVSRFIKSLGLTSFSELRQLLLTNNQTATFYLSETSVSALEKTNVSAVHETVQSISIDSIDELCKEINQSSDVFIFGLGKAESAAICLQNDLLSLGKKTYSTIQFKEQIECIEKADKNTLILIFSATGSYFDYFDIRQMQKRFRYLNIWYIGGGTTPAYISHHISYTTSNFFSHPIPLIIAAQLIAQRYAHYLKENE